MDAREQGEVDRKVEKRRKEREEAKQKLKEERAAANKILREHNIQLCYDSFNMYPDYRLSYGIDLIFDSTLLIHVTICSPEDQWSRPVAREKLAKMALTGKSGYLIKDFPTTWIREERPQLSSKGFKRVASIVKCLVMADSALGNCGVPRGIYHQAMKRGFYLKKGKENVRS